MNIRRTLSASALVAAALSAAACEDKPKGGLAPTASALKAPDPPATRALELSVDQSHSGASFVMDAPLEKIHGEASASISGEIFLDLMDLTKSTGLVKADLMKLELYQQKRGDEKEEYGEKVKNDTQNKHMRTWFEISDDAPEEAREKNRYVEFRITSVESPSVRGVSSLTGDERTFTATLAGDLRLHQRVAQKKVKVEVTVNYEKGQPKAIQVKTLEPLVIGLEEHDVRPRDAFGSLAKRTLDALGSKVTKEVPVNVHLEARVKN